MNKRCIKSVVLAGGLIFLTTSAYASDSNVNPDMSLWDMSLEELVSQTFYSAAKREKKVEDTAAAVYVITEEDIQRSSASTIPELLRYVPGMMVAQNAANQWAVTARGNLGVHNSINMLVLVDGRTVYSPIYSGVVWSGVDVPLERIKRIEVIRGPGASLWGANAVNGVINILTKDAADNEGVRLTMSAGSELQEVYMSYGNKEEHYAYNVYGKAKYHNELKESNGSGAKDEFESVSVGSDMDWTLTSRDELQFKLGYLHSNREENLLRADPGDPLDFFQFHLVNGSVVSDQLFLSSTWQHKVSESNRFNLQFNFDRQDFDQVDFDYYFETYDFNFEQVFNLGDKHTLVYGANYRYHDQETRQGLSLVFDPADRSWDQGSIFAQDDWQISESLSVTAGARLEYYDFTGYEFQPTLRALWQYHSQHAIWGAVSRSVREPSRFELDGNVLLFQTVGIPPFIAGYSIAASADNLDSEKTDAIELGFRGRFGGQFSYDLTGFYNKISDAVEREPEAAVLSSKPVFDFFSTPYVKYASVADNNAEAHAYGAEAALDYYINSDHKLKLIYTYFNYRSDKGARASQEVRNPENIASLIWQANIHPSIKTMLAYRYVDSFLPDDLGFVEIPIDSYTELDAKISYAITPEVDISLVGTNLLSQGHAESKLSNSSQPSPYYVQQSIFLKVDMQF